MANNSSKARRDAFLFWWPFGLQLFGFGLGTAHLLWVGFKDPDTVTMAFCGLAIATGKAFDLQERWNQRSTPPDSGAGAEAPPALEQGSNDVA